MNKFKKINRQSAKKILGLDTKKDYFLYVGRGGSWRKGLDRAIKLMKEVHSQKENTGIIIIGPEDNHENKILINEVSNFATYLPLADREIISKYYGASETFFCFSRYEGGAPILTLSEAMASGCLPVCSKDSNQEIIKDNINGIVLNNFDAGDAKRIIDLIKNKNEKQRMIKNSLKVVKELSLTKWGNKYLRVLLK